MPRRALPILFVSLALFLSAAAARATALAPVPELPTESMTPPLPPPSWDAGEFSPLFEPALLARSSAPSAVPAPEPQPFFLIGFGLLAVGLIGTRTLKQ
jgi:hypothetical protein